MNLFPHNQKAADAVMANFKTSDRAAVVHACGTGKSLIGGAVAENFKNVLIVAPNDHVLGQASKTAPKAECRTYAWISMQDVMPTGYDLIWFDEFHRMGAETWSVGCERLISANPTAKILGTTATSERSLERRDMAEEWFENDVVSTLTLSDAWLQRILRVPVYVIGVISMDDTRNDYKAKIKSAKRIDEKHKKQANVLLDNVLLDWNNAYGVPRIIQKYIDKDVERIIVFAQSISKLEEVKETLPNWFKEAGIKVGGIYRAHSGMGAEAIHQVKAFEADDSEGVKILISVDMLNEGVHVDRVDAVILFRATISKNIYMQQIGRCFAVGQKHQPIILDLADNLTKACGYECIYEAKRKVDEAREFANPLNKEKGGDKFLVIDTLKETRDILAQIDKITADSRSWDEIAEYIKAFHTEHGKLPGRKDDESVYAYMNMHRREYYVEKYPERIAFLESLGWQRVVEDNSLTFDEAFEMIKAYKEEHGELPTCAYKPMKSIKGRLRHNGCTDEQKARLAEIGVTHTTFMENWMARYNEMKAVYDATGSLESCNKAQRSWIYSQQSTKKLNKEQRDLLEAIGAFDLKKIRGYHKGDYYILKVVDWVKEHGYLPSISEDKLLYSTWRNAYRNQGDYWARFKAYGIDETLIREKETFMDKLADFYEEHNRLPDKGEELFEEMKSCMMVEKNREYAIQHWGYKDERDKNFERKFAEFKKYVQETGYLPRTYAHEGEEMIWARFILNNTKPTAKHREEVEAFISGYEQRPAVKITKLSEKDYSDWASLKEYVTTNSRVPAKNDPLFSLIGRFANIRTVADEYKELFAPFGYGETVQWLQNAVKVQGIKDFYNEHGRLPGNSDDGGLYDTLQLSKRWVKKGIYKIWTDLFEQMGFNYEKNQIRLKYEACRQRVIDFLKENKRLPSGKLDGTKMVQDFGNFRRLHREEYDTIIKTYLS